MSCLCLTRASSQQAFEEKTGSPDQARAVEEQTSLVREAKMLWPKLVDRYALSPKRKWSKADGFSLLSPSTKNWWKVRIMALVSRIVRFVKALFAIVKRLFILSMKAMDTIAAFSFNSSARNLAINEMFVNCDKALKMLSDDKERLLDCLKSNKRVIRHILESTQSVFTYKQLVKTVEKTLKVTKKITDGVGKVSSAAGAVGRDALQRACFGLCQTVGMTDALPDSWIPPFHVPWIERRRTGSDSERFPPVHCVQRIDRKALLEIKVQQTLMQVQPFIISPENRALLADFKKLEEQIRRSYTLVNT